MKWISGFAAIVVAGAGLVGWLAFKLNDSAMPTIPSSMAPLNGAVIEYWPNQQVRSERIYRNGQVQEAVYYSSDGKVVFEMSSDNA